MVQAPLINTSQHQMGSQSLLPTHLKTGAVNYSLFSNKPDLFFQRKRKALAPSSSRASLHVMSQSNNNQSPYGSERANHNHGTYLQHRELVYFAPGSDSKHLKYLDSIYDVIESEKHQNCVSLMTRTGMVPPIGRVFKC